MNNLRRCTSMMTLGFGTPQSASYYVNGHFIECDVHDPRVQTTEQFWCGVYAMYCATHYNMNVGSKIRIAVKWDDVFANLSTERRPRNPYDEPMDSKTFFRLLSGTSPDSVRTQIPVDWEFLSPALEFGTDPQPVEEPTYEELL